MFKQTIILFLLFIFLLAGCNNTTNNSENEPITISIWHYYNGIVKSSFDELVDDFNKTIGVQKGIIIEPYSQGDISELAEAVIRASQSSNASDMPNIFSAYSDSAFVIDKLSMLVDLRDYFSDEELSEYHSSFIDEGKISGDDSLKIMPTAKSTENLFVNAKGYNKFIEATGTDKNLLSTWEGLIETAGIYYEWTDSLTVTPNDGKAFFGLDSMANFMLIASEQLGETLIDSKNKKLNFNKETAKKIWDSYYVPYVNGYFSSSGRFRSDDTRTGIILSYIGSSSGASYFPTRVETSRDYSYPIDCMVLSYPNFKDMPKYAVQQGAGFSVVKSSKQQEAAACEFLKWFTDPKQNLKFSVSTGCIPVKTSAMSFENFIDEVDKTSNGFTSVIECAKSTFQMLSTYKLFFSPAFDEGLSVRKLLENSLTSFAIDDYEKIQLQIESGVSRQDAVMMFTSQKNFEKWFNQLLGDAAKILE